MTSNETNGIQKDMVAEAVRVAERAQQEDVALRLLGGVAIRVRATESLQPAFEREYADLDWITPKGKSSRVQKFFEALGYAPQTRFNALYGRERLLYFDEQNDRQVDVLIGTFRMSHEIPFGNRMTLEPLTVPLAELLLTKCQIIELNEKDVREALALLHDHPVSEEDGENVNGAHIERLRLRSLAHLHGQPRSPRRPPAALRPSRRRQSTHQGPHRNLAGAHRGGVQELRLEDAGEVWRPQTLVRAARGGGRRTMMSKLFSHEPDTSIFLATDIHGSETCWRKFLNSGMHYEADVMVLGGDMTGKALISKVEQGGVATTRAAPTRTR